MGTPWQAPAGAGRDPDPGRFTGRPLFRLVLRLGRKTGTRCWPAAKPTPSTRSNISSTQRISDQGNRSALGSRLGAYTSSCDKRQLQRPRPGLALGYGGSILPMLPQCPASSARTQAPPPLPHAGGSGWAKATSGCLKRTAVTAGAPSAEQQLVCCRLPNRFHLGQLAAAGAALPAGLGGGVSVSVRSSGAGAGDGCSGTLVRRERLSRLRCARTRCVWTLKPHVGSHALERHMGRDYGNVFTVRLCACGVRFAFWGRMYGIVPDYQRGWVPYRVTKVNA